MDQDHENLKCLTTDELYQALERTEQIEKLINQRRRLIRLAYLKLPAVDNRENGSEVDIPLQPEFGFLKIIKDEDELEKYLDRITFVVKDGRWAVTVEEYNRVLYKGAYI